MFKEFPMGHATGRMLVSSGGPPSARGVYGDVTFFTHNGKTYAVKRFTRKEKVLSAARAEATVLGFLRARGVDVPKLVSLTEQGDQQVLVMSAVSGTPLRDLLYENTGGMSLETAWEHLRPLAVEIAKMHALGVYHNDLNMLNLLVHGHAIRMIDFGEACVMRGHPLSSVKGMLVCRAGYTPRDTSALAGFLVNLVSGVTHISKYSLPAVQGRSYRDVFGKEFVEFIINALDEPLPIEQFIKVMDKFTSYQVLYDE